MKSSELRLLRGVLDAIQFFSLAPCDLLSVADRQPGQSAEFAQNAFMSSLPQEHEQIITHDTCMNSALAKKGEGGTLSISKCFRQVLT